MKFGIMVPNWEPFSYDIRIYEKFASVAEQLEYDSFLISDHFMRPGLDTTLELAKRHATIETWSLLAYLAAKTESIRIGSCVTPLPVRQPQQLAKVVSTIDNLSNGRVVFGVGTGYGNNELNAYAPSRLAFPRVNMTAEALTLIKRLWTEDVVDFKGEFYESRGAIVEPKPIQKPHPPIWIGQNVANEEMFRLVSDYADGWIPSRTLRERVDLHDVYKLGVKKLSSISQTRGKKILMGLTVYISDNDYAPQYLPATKPLATIDTATTALENYERLGCQYAIIIFVPINRFTTLLKRFREDVIPSFS